MDQHLTRVSLESPFGVVSILWLDGSAGLSVTRILLPNERRLAEEVPPAAPPAAISKLSEDLRRFLEGDPVTFTLDFLALASCSLFQQSVLLAESRVPRGCVTTYGRIAAHLGAPLAARAVGGALARNPFPIVIPCHRAIRSDGHLGGFRGGLDMKRRLLELEGVPMSNAGPRASQRCQT